ncbi:VanW family protein [Quadrisphaera sp. DSM 44207]|uniref:VanW family protein n=1 Tax=Quadrisphaera sp. DSM 44207 TaxID=1881057 RepID=UPI00088343CC|nr:VanW family protein [Quadrisphaera sp. DSM 44207]SDQ71076.1 Vancomycin resistance protein YoaR, contains peptidoglycan-binding and VanW domains [Quadrisphaera sp. DSM 44207]
MSTATTRRETRAERSRDGSAPRWRRRAVLLPTVAGAVVLGYGGAAWALGDQVPRSTTVAGVDVGGLQREAAARALADGLQRAGTEFLDVRVGHAEGQLDPARAGLALDAAASVDAAAGAPADPRTLWRHLVGGGDVAPVTDVDEGALATELQALAAQVDVAPVEGAVTFDGGVATPTAPAAGLALQVEQAAGVLADGWLTAAQPLRLPATEQQPAVGQEAVDEAMASFGQPATSGPLTVVVAGSRVELSPAAVAPALSFAAEDGRLRPQVDGELLGAAVQEADPDAFVAAKDASVEIRDGKPVVVPAVDGERLDPGPLAEAALSALASEEQAERTVTATVAPAEAELTTEEAGALGVVEVVSEFSTQLTPDPLRTENLQTASARVDGTLLMPGEVFSLNDALGRRTAENGYHQAPVISGGRLAMDFGGGVSQMATTLFNAVFFAGLEDVEHKPHSFYISRYPEGREATVNYGTIDMRFRNDSEHAVLMQTWVGGGQLHARFWSTKTWDVEASKSARRNVVQPKTIVDDSEGCVPQSPHVGFDVTVTRTFLRDGQVARTEDFSTRYVPEDSVRCVDPQEQAEPAPADGAAPDASSGAGSGAAPDPGPDAGSDPASDPEDATAAPSPQTEPAG